MEKTTICCNNCAFMMKIKTKFKCSLANAFTQPQYKCDMFLDKVKFVKDMKNSKI